MHNLSVIVLVWIFSTGVLAQKYEHAASSTQQLDTQRTCSLEKSWNDKGSGADLDGFFYLPVVDSSAHIIGGYGTQEKKLTAEDCMLAVGASAQLVEPIAWELIWLDKGSGARLDGSMWRAVPPSEDYRCIGTVPQIDYEKPDLPNYRCVPAMFTEKVVSSTVIWTDEGSGARKPVSMFRLPNSGSFVAVPGRLAQIEAVDLRLTPVVPDTAAASQGAAPAEATPAAEQVTTSAEASEAAAERQVAEAEQPVEVPVSVVEEKAEAPDGPSVSSKALALLKEMDPETIKEVLSAAGVTGDSGEGNNEPQAAPDTEAPKAETESDQVVEQPLIGANENVSDEGNTAQDSVGSSDGLSGGGEQVTKEQPVGADSGLQPVEHAAAQQPAKTPGLPAGVSSGELCTVIQDGIACWKELENQPGCYVWISWLLGNETVTWNGKCASGLAEGSGTVIGVMSDIDGQKVNYTATGQFQRGKAHNQWVIFDHLDNEWKGPFVDGKAHGQWVIHHNDGAIQDGSFVDDKMHGEWIHRDDDGFVFRTIYEHGEYIDMIME